MRRVTYHRRSLFYHWRTNLAVALGAAAGTAALTGALIVGDSMRASLREIAVGRLGRVDHALIAPRFFEASLASRVSGSPDFSPHFEAACPAILLRAGLTHAERRTRVNGVNVIGVDEAFWHFHGLDPPQRDGGFSGRFVLLNETLAHDLQADIGDDVLLRIGKHSPISTETLLGRRDETVTTLRLPVRGIIPDNAPSNSRKRIDQTSIHHQGPDRVRAASAMRADNQPRALARADTNHQPSPGPSAATIGQFSLNLRQSVPRNVFVPIGILQRGLDQSDRANAIMVSTRDTNDPRAAGFSLRDPSESANNRLVSILQRTWTIDDIGLRLRIDNDRGYVAIESESILIEPVIERGIDRVMLKRGYDDSKILAHLANRIAINDNETGIPYSTIVALDLPDRDPNRQSTIDNQQSSPISLNEWAANDLGVTVGQSVNITYYITTLQGRIEERTATFQLAGVIPMDHRLADPGLVPTYPGITDVDRLSDWNAPFPIDFARIRDQDEDYWDKYRTLPKAYIDLRMGQKLWAPHGDRHGRITSVLVRPQSTTDNQQATTNPDSDTNREPRFVQSLELGVQATGQREPQAQSTGEYEPRAQSERLVRRVSHPAEIRTATVRERVFEPKRIEPAQDHNSNGTATIREQEAREPLDELAADIAATFTSEVDPASLGLKFEPIRAQALTASDGTTDFGLLFIGFSFFLIASAAMLVALLFRLGIERRASEIGLLLANGFTPAAVGRMLLGQGTIIAFIGGIVGLIGAGGYAWLMLAGLRTWWSAAVNTPVLRLEATPASLIIGLSASVLIALLSMAWAVRGLTRRSPRALLAGAVSSDRTTASPKSGRNASVTAIAALFTAIVLIFFTINADAQTQAGAFFGAGAAVIVALLALLRRFLQGRAAVARGEQGSYLLSDKHVASASSRWDVAPHDSSAPQAASFSLRGFARAEASGSLSEPPPTTQSTASGITTLGIRNASRHVGRSMLTAGLIASATFVIASIQAFRLQTDTHWVKDKHSGSGGFALYAESGIPLPYDLSTPDGRDALGLDRDARTLLDDAAIFPFRLRPGDESSCLNLYRPTEPRILGATDAMIDRGGFAFSDTLAETDAERQNPWLLLGKTFKDGAIPAIADEAAVRWQFHLGLGQDLIIRDDRGLQQRLRFVALLKQSLLQDEVIVAESYFNHLFPSIAGHGFFLIDAEDDQRVPPAQGDSDKYELMQQSLERSLERFSFDVRRSADRINEYLAVQNTYLSTFRNLGGLGLLLGTTGLAAVLLRNVWERRRELALLRALGFSHAAIGWMVLAENAALLLYGLGAGFLSALVAIAPTIASDPASVPWLSVLGTLMAVLIVGLGVSVAAIIPTLRTPLLPALRSE
jgi:ABC-type antimicrobial peptide transport system permease subunit